MRRRATLDTVPGGIGVHHRGSGGRLCVARPGRRRTRRDRSRCARRQYGHVRGEPGGRAGAAEATHRTYDTRWRDPHHMIGHDPDRTYRAAVIGAGSGGLTLAIGLAGFGHDVVLIEGGRVGGDCTNVGCIPSKALLHAARSGIDDPLARTRAKRDDLAYREDMEMAEHERVHLVRGWASLTAWRDPYVVSVDGGGSTGVVRAEHVVFAGGSRPVVIDIDGLDDDRVVTNEGVFELESAPANLVIIGGGAIAIEMATAFAALGTRVDIVELRDRLLAQEDPLITEVLERSLHSQGVGL